MRLFAVLLALCLAPRLAAAQEGAKRDTVPDQRFLPAEIANEVTDAFNAPGTLHTVGKLEIDVGRTVSGDVAVVDGPVTIAGTVAGRVVAINADVRLQPGARVEGEILIVGGTLEGRDQAFIGGDVRIYRQRLDYRREGDRIVAQGNNDVDERWWRRRQRWRSRTYTDLRLLSARTYNRVEGLPVLIGPSFARTFPGGRFSIDAFGVFRTADGFEWNSSNIGHSVKSELRFGRHRGIAIGGRLYDMVDGVENWQLSDTEVGLASFFLHRDYRDYYDRHGGGGSITAFLGDADLTASLSDELWGSRVARSPFTLFRNGADWRPNPQLDDGRMHIANATLRFDTRNSVDHPLSGWYLVADYEHGTGHITSFGPTSPGVRDVRPGHIAYDRGFVDVRRYNRLSPDAQLNFRFVTGGWLGGDALPLQRRFSVGGPGTLPGFDFRRTRQQAEDGTLTGSTDVGQCGGALAPAGTPAQCDRMMLAQVEYRGDLSIDLFHESRHWRTDGWSRGAQWVVFADAGRGWLVGARDGTLRYPSGAIPSLGTWRTDIGVGIALPHLGFYIAKAVSESKEPPNFIVRVKRRF